MNNEKLYVLFEEVSLLADKLQHAIIASNNLADINADSKNVTEIINRFSELELLTNNKIEEINTVSQFFSKQSYRNSLIALIISIIIGLSVGYFVAQKAFIEHIQNDILKAKTDAIASAQIDLETEKLSMENYLKAKNKGVEFYNNAIMMPVSKNNIEEKDNKAIYFYKKNE